MNEILVLIGAGIAVLLGIMHMASTRVALKGFPELGPDESGMLHAMWHGIGFMLFFLGGLPIALVLLNLWAGRAGTVVGIAITAYAAVMAFSDYIAYRKATVAMGKAVPFIFAAIAVLMALGTFL